MIRVVAPNYTGANDVISEYFVTEFVDYGAMTTVPWPPEIVTLPVVLLAVALMLLVVWPEAETTVVPEAALVTQC